MVEGVILKNVGLDMAVQRPTERLGDLLLAESVENIRIEVEEGAVIVVELKEKLEILQVRDLRRAVPLRLQNHQVARSGLAPQAYCTAGRLLRGRLE